MLRRPAIFHATATILLMVLLVAVGRSSWAQKEDLAKDRYEEAKANFQAERWQEAVTGFSATLELTSNKARQLNAYYFRGYAYYKLGRCTEATADLQKVIESNPAGTNTGQVKVANEVIRGCVQSSASAQQDGSAQQNGAVLCGVMMGSTFCGPLKDGPASRAGLRNGDLVVAIDSIEIKDCGALAAFLMEHMDERVVFSIRRGTEARLIPVSLGHYDRSLGDWQAPMAQAVLGIHGCDTPRP